MRSSTGKLEGVTKATPEEIHRLAKDTVMFSHYLLIDLTDIYATDEMEFCKRYSIKKWNVVPQFTNKLVKG